LSATSEAFTFAFAATPLALSATSSIAALIFLVSMGRLLPSMPTASASAEPLCTGRDRAAIARLSQSANARAVFCRGKSRNARAPNAPRSVHAE
jgi:hypothetical protein